jgi:hypothetical protein
MRCRRSFPRPQREHQVTNLGDRFVKVEANPLKQHGREKRVVGLAGLEPATMRLLAVVRATRMRNCATVP